MSLAGVWLLTGGPQLSLNLGDALMLAAALLRAVLVCLTRRLTAGREIPALALTAVQSGVVAAGCILLAVSLLTNTRGEIDINLPISGSLDDPKFSVGGIIVQVIVNLLTKVITAIQKLHFIP